MSHAKSYFLCGVGGSGMLPLALILRGRAEASADQIVVRPAAVEDTVPDIIAAKRVGADVLGRAELLSQLFNSAPVRIGVAGTSGKSTTTGMIAWLLYRAGLKTPGCPAGAGNVGSATH